MLTLNDIVVHSAGVHGASDWQLAAVLSLVEAPQLRVFAGHHFEQEPDRLSNVLRCEMARFPGLPQPPEDTLPPELRQLKATQG